MGSEASTTLGPPARTTTAVTAVTPAGWPERTDRQALLTERQGMVLRAIVQTFLASPLPVGSKTISQLLSVKLSSASIRNTMGELEERALIEKAHASSGRVPTASGLRLFVDHLLSSGRELAYHQRDELSHTFADVENEALVETASRLLSDCTRQLGFVVAPALERVVLRHISLVRLSSDRVLVVLVTRDGQSHRRVVQDGSGDQAELDRMATRLNERLHGCTLETMRQRLQRELLTLRSEAGGLLQRALQLGLRALEEGTGEGPSLVVASRLALLEHPDFEEPGRLRELLAAVEASERLLELLQQILDGPEEVEVALGPELEGLASCAVVAAPYGDERSSLGVLGVIGTNRMDYARIIPLVRYCSRLVTRKLSAEEGGRA